MHMACELCPYGTARSALTRAVWGVVLKRLLSLFLHPEPRPGAVPEHIVALFAGAAGGRSKDPSVPPGIILLNCLL